MRSIRSWIVEHLLKRLSNKDSFTDEQLYSEFLKERQKENEKPYVLPKYIQRKFHIKKQSFNGMDCYIFNQEKKQSEKSILYLHGGGYIKQPSVYHWSFLGKIAEETAAKIYVPIYPKAPNHQYKESFDKVLPVYEWILETSNEKNIILMGDSAGGGFALALAQLLLEKGLSQPGKIILLSPWLDITMKNPDAYVLEDKDPMLGIYGLIQMGKAYAGDTNLNHYLLSPINGKINGLGKISLFIGTHEVFLPDARRFRDIALSQGARINYFEYPKMNHIFVLYPIPEAKKATKEIVNIIRNF
ncbi:alpha/beta hydrolase fold domain-containing protein [Lederbergia galactosidilytica]|uniref:Hydrolase n=1 Tax=Lederbergia galactosidilytica TaxID=217031 RepID=A0A177ZM24_9BACI|nr:alpha/beta hydrolase [Lederbergia galactosidilytica]KRG15284.1 hydrolase [Virgibacillus soli]OAK69032.1 hydrolase [Lederbergia galactosidilytica]